jgi:hypothetical protein
LKVGARGLGLAQKKYAFHALPPSLIERRNCRQFVGSCSLFFYDVFPYSQLQLGKSPTTVKKEAFN